MDDLIDKDAYNFNPRSHERSDVSVIAVSESDTYFNPRSHERSDVPVAFAFPFDQCISIHAPTRGATPAPLNITTIEGFQSTLPREERH